MTTLLPLAKQQFSDANGVPLAGGSVTFYIPGTTTPKNTWQDSGQLALNTNPVILDASGEAIIYGQGAYRSILKDSLGNQIWDQLTASTDTGGFYSGGTSTGSANNQIVAAPTPSGFSLVAGNTITFIAGFSNAGPTTLNANGTGAKPIFKTTSGGPIALIGGEIIVNSAIELFYDGTQYQIVGGGPLLSDPVPIANGGTGATTFPSLTNTRLAKTALYTVANADKGKTIALGGSAFYVLTFSAASGYDANFSALVINEDTGRGKNIVLTGGTNFILWPGQSCVVFNQNNVWKVNPSSQRWVKASAVFFVDPVLGNDSNDGLASGTGAFLTIQGGYNVIRQILDTGGPSGPPTINLADGTHDVGSGVNINYALVGDAQLLIVGNIATPDNVLVRSSVANGACFAARDGGATATLSGMKLTTNVNGTVMINATQNSVIDICGSGPVNFDAAPLGVHMSCSVWASINVLGSYRVEGSAATHIAVANNGYINYGSFTVTGVSNLTFTNFATGQNSGTISAGGVAMTFAGFGAVTAKKYTFSSNSVLDSSSATFPGGTAGTTTTGGQAS